jgi:NAD(P)-dependent dehydrogenase (short-subunit alcohol dehydrogenase family)
MSRVWRITGGSRGLGRAVAEAPVHPHRRTARQLVPLCTRRVAPVTLVDGRCPRVPHTARV